MLLGTTSGIPPTALVIKGKPAAAVSNTTYGNDLNRDGNTMMRPSFAALPWACDP